MTKRFFYTDPLAAAWMAKHFKMKFDDPCGDSTNPESGAAQRWHQITDFYRRGKFHMHPDSLHLLEPQVGDICMCRLHLDDPASEILPYKIHVPDTKHDVVAIVQRNGIPFMWPENEDA